MTSSSVLFGSTSGCTRLGRKQPTRREAARQDRKEGVEVTRRCVCVSLCVCTNAVSLWTNNSLVTNFLWPFSLRRTSFGHMDFLTKGLERFSVQHKRTGQRLEVKRKPKVIQIVTKYNCDLQVLPLRVFFSSQS